MNPTETGYPANVGPNTYALLRGLAQGLAVEDAMLQQVLGAARLQSSMGSAIDSWAYDVFAGTFYRFAQYGETDIQWIARIEAIFATPKCTLPGMQEIINVFWPWIILQFGTGNLATDVGIGGLDTGQGGLDVTTSSNSGITTTTTGEALGVGTYGGADTEQQFIDAPQGTLPIIPIVFDQQSNPTLAATITPNIVPPYFCVYLQNPKYSDTFIHPVLSPSLILSQLVATWRAVGTVPIYASNH